MAKKKTDNTAEIGFEQQIWKAADKLRGNIDASAVQERRAGAHLPEIHLGQIRT